MATLRSLTPNIMVESVNKTVDFYRDVLQFEMVSSVPEEGVLDWAWVKRGDVGIMFQTRPSLGGEIPVLQEKPFGGALTFYTKVEGIEDLYAELKEKVTIVQEIRTTFYGAREFAFEDCNGYIWSFGEDV